LRATDGAGHLLIGADVAIAMWRVTPGERWLATLAGNPVVRPITRVVYDRFADLLHAWNRRKGRW
jgi:predicted DCC family thiol-disulfide oxidoreductase YuxK